MMMISYYFGNVSTIWLVLLLLFVPFCSASITIVDSGKEYSSKLDKLYGAQLMRKGLQYPAHLQQIPGNAHLCYDHSQWQNWNVTRPSDGTPVALLVKRGNCDNAAKARYASKLIQPPGVVKFLIIDGDEHMKENYDKEEEEYMLATAPMIPSVLEFPTDYQNHSSSSLASSSSTSYGGESRNLLRHHHHHDHDNNNRNDPITVSLLHVTFGTGYDLLELIMREMPQIRNSGGTKITLNADSPQTTPTLVILLWFCFAFFMALSACCCLTTSISNLLEAANMEDQQATARGQRRRRRLTRDQVRNNIPIGIFNGSQLVYSAEQQGDDDDDDETQESLIAASGGPPEPHSLEGCTICLEEYISGEKLRCLPCQHTFHAKCIGKWLTERSSTCPLCKIDLYESEDEEEDDDGNDNNNNNNAETRESPTNQPRTSTTNDTTTTNDALAGSWASVPPETQATPTASQQHTTTTTSEGPTTSSSESQWFQRGYIFGSWGRNLFSRRSRRAPTNTTTNTTTTTTTTTPLSEPSPGSIENDTLTTPLLVQEDENSTTDTASLQSLDHHGSSSSRRRPNRNNNDTTPSNAETPNATESSSLSSSPGTEAPEIV